jgi:phosphoserine phosphatase
MNGEIPLDEVYRRRLEIIRPTRDAVESLGRRYVDSLVRGAAEVISALRDGGATVHLVSAGIAQAIAPLGERLGISSRNIHAVALEFDAAGAYVDFDRRSLLTRNGGKELVVRSIVSRAKGTSAFVGDGASDLETKGVVDRFIGFGGVHVRPIVEKNADVFVAEPTLQCVLPYLMEN